MVQLEISARDAMSEPGIEEAARLAWQTESAKPEEEQDPRLDLIEAFIDSNDLVEANVVGAMNSSYAFYLGMVDGGPFEMTEEDILREVWSTEDESRRIRAMALWLHDDVLPAARGLRRSTAMWIWPKAPMAARSTAAFAGFDRMYTDISYALGRALAQQMTAQDL